MHDQSDTQLLCAYAETGSETAFRELVTRHTDFVFSAALRQVESPDLAADLAQGVFTDLARKALAVAEKMRLQSSLAGWLHRSTRYAALNLLRDTRRRQSNERQAMEQLLTNSKSPADWEQIRPVLDEALDSLDDDDREAVLLRYFENQNFRTVGLALGISDNTAQKRVTRAVEKLREFIAQRKVTIGTAGLVALISANAVTAAPAGLAVTITATALAGTAVSTATVLAATKTITMTILQKTLITVAITALAGAGIYEAREVAELRAQNLTLQQQQAPLAYENLQLQRDLDDAKNRLAAALAKTSRPATNPNQDELLKLRGENTQLKLEENDPTQKTIKAVAAKINQLKQRLDQNPNWKIPELQFVTEKDWAEAAWDADLNTDDGVRSALSKVRETAINTVLNVMMKNAFKKYLAANNDKLPDDLFALKPYFDQPVADAMLQRYKLLQSGTPNNSADLVRLNTNVDEEYDSNHGMSINGAWGSRFNRVQEAVNAAAGAFAADHFGQIPSATSQLDAYLKTPVDQAAIQKYLTQIQADPPSADLDHAWADDEGLCGREQRANAQKPVRFAAVRDHA